MCLRFSMGREASRTSVARCNESFRGRCFQRMKSYVRLRTSTGITARQNRCKRDVAPPNPRSERIE